MSLTKYSTLRSTCGSLFSDRRVRRCRRATEFLGPKLAKCSPRGKLKYGMGVITDMERLLRILVKRGGHTVVITSIETFRKPRQLVPPGSIWQKASLTYGVESDVNMLCKFVILWKSPFPHTGRCLLCLLTCLPACQPDRQPRPAKYVHQCNKFTYREAALNMIVIVGYSIERFSVPSGAGSLSWAMLRYVQSLRVSVFC